MPVVILRDLSPVLFWLPLPPPWGAKGEVVGSSDEKIKAHWRAKGHGLREQGKCTLVGTTRSKFTENELFVHWCIASTRRHSNICWIRWTEPLNTQLEYLYFILVPFNMNYLKTFKPSADTFGRPSSQKEAIGISLQLNCHSKKSHKRSMINAWMEGGRGRWSIQLKIQYLKI